MANHFDFRNSPAPSRRPPPDYSQRGVKLRLFTYLALLMFVLGMIERARDPQAWQWLWDLDRQAAEQERFDNRLEPTALRTAGDPQGTFVAAADPSSVWEEEALSTSPDAVEWAWQQGWRDVLPRLSADDRELLFELLATAKHKSSLPPAKTATIAALAEQLGQHWSDYLAAARQSLAASPGADQPPRTDVLEQVQQRVTAGTLPALAAIAAGQALTEAQSAALAALEPALVRVARSSVQDDTVVFRPAERDYWFYELARVQDAGAANPPGGQAPRVSYLQLAKQPADYRGKPVTVAGTVRLAERVPAPPNYLGVTEYYVYWLQPAGGPDSPLVVYALAAPPGFPRVKSRDEQAGSPARIREAVEVTGVFIKRCAYAAQGGTYTAPLLVAHTPRWIPPAPVAARRPITSFELAAAAIGALLLAICVTAVAWKRTGRTRRTAAQPAHGGFVPLGPLSLGPTPEESLRELERQARSEGSR